MELEDARSLSPQAQQALRKRAVAAVVKQGRSQKQVAQELGVTPTAVNQWVQRYRAQGEAALAARKQGRPRHPSLSDEQAAETTRLMREHAPDQLGLPYSLWTREAVGQLIQQQWGIQLSQTYLRAWGLSPQKPAKRAREQCPEAVRGWIAYRYPALHRRAQQERGQIHWGDEMGLRSDHQAGTCWAPKGLLDFLRHLVRSVPRKVFLIVDRHPVHRAHLVQQWVAQHSDQLELFYLPAYSPERNPDEYLNQDIKANATHQRRPRNTVELVQAVQSYLHQLQQWPEKLSHFFWGPEVEYAGL